MIAVYKYPLLNPQSAVDLPLGAEVLHVAEQHGQVQMWAKVNTKAPAEMRIFQIFGTGHEIPNDGKERAFVSTFFVKDGLFVFHVFEVLK
jgi:hypothetical protein